MCSHARHTQQRKNQRMLSVNNVISSLEHAQGLTRTMSVNSRAVHDTEGAVLDLLDEKLEKWSREGQRRCRVCRVI